MAGTWLLDFAGQPWRFVIGEVTRLTYNCAHLRSTKESLTFEYLDISWYRWYWASRRRYWLVLGGTGSVWGGPGSYLEVLGQYGEELVDT